MNNKFTIYRFGGLISFLGLAGCTLFNPISDRARLFEIGFSRKELVTPSVKVASLRLELEYYPEYINHLQMTTRIGPHELKNNPLCRWISPLPERVLYIIRQDISQSFPKIRIEEFPKNIASDVDLTVKLHIDTLIFDEISQQIILSGTWIFLDKNRKWMSGSDFDFHEPLPSNSDRYGTIIAKMEQVIIHLGDTIGEQLSFVLSQN